MAARLLRLLILTVGAICGCLYLLSNFRERDASEIATGGSSTATQSKCDADDIACESNAAHAAPKGQHKESTQVPAKQKAPEHLDYPKGFQHFDTSDPQSPYNQETYDLSESNEETSSKSIMADTEATYLKRLHAWVPYNARYNIGNQNPVIWQTFREEPGELSKPYASWLELNQPRWTRTFVGDTKRDSFVAAMSRDLPFLDETYRALPTKILKLDFLRYLSLYKDGGVYADIDTYCYKSIDSWYSACYSATPKTRQGERVRSPQPGLIVGVEFDVQDDPEYRNIDGRQLALANYVFAANQGHPALAKMLSRIVDQTLNSSTLIKTHNATDDLETFRWTGRRAWTDCIVSYVQETVQGFKEKDLLNLKRPKLVGDICILPIEAFGSGQKQFKNSPESVAEGVLVKHFGMHTWDS